MSTPIPNPAASMSTTAVVIPPNDATTAQPTKPAIAPNSGSALAATTVSSAAMGATPAAAKDVKINAEKFHRVCSEIEGFPNFEKVPMADLKIKEHYLGQTFFCLHPTYNDSTATIPEVIRNSVRPGEPVRRYRCRVKVDSKTEKEYPEDLNMEEYLLQISLDAKGVPITTIFKLEEKGYVLDQGKELGIVYGAPVITDRGREITSGPGAYYPLDMTMDSPLSKIFTVYGFNDAKQTDFMQLLYLAGCMDSEKLTADLRSVGLSDKQIQLIKAKMQLQQTTHSTSAAAASATTVTSAGTAAADTTKAKPDFASFVQAFSLSAFENSDPNYLEKVLNWLVKVTQREFFARAPGVERWQQATGAWMTAQEKEIREVVARLGLCSAQNPKGIAYDAVAVFGSTAPNMEGRLKFAKMLIDSGLVKTTGLVLLAGERAAQADEPMVPDTAEKKGKPAVLVDGPAAYLKEVAESNGIAVDKVTETHLIQDVHRRLAESDPQSVFAKLPKPLIANAKKGDKPRPNTIDNLELLKTFPGFADAKSVLFISSAPHITSQYEDVLTVFGTASAHRLGIAGGACSDSTALNRIMGALGGSLFGGYINKALCLGIPKSRAELAANLKTFSYEAQMKAAAAMEAKKAADVKMAAEGNMQPMAATAPLKETPALSATSGASILLMLSGAGTNASKAAAPVSPAPSGTAAQSNASANPAIQPTTITAPAAAGVNATAAAANVGNIDKPNMRG